MQCIAGGPPRERKRNSYQLAALIGQVAKPDIYFRLVAQLRVEIDVRIEVLQIEPVMMDVAAMGGGGEHGLGGGATDRARYLELAATLGSEKTQIVRGDVETQIELIVETAVERDVGPSQAEPDVLERPGSAGMKQLAVAARLGAPQLPPDVAEMLRGIACGRKAVGGDGQRVIQLSAQIGTEITWIDAGEPPRRRPGALGRPGDVAVDAPVPLEQIHFGSTPGEVIFPERAIDYGVHQWKGAHPGYAVHLHVIREYALQGVGARGTVERNVLVLAHQRPAKVAPVALQIQARPSFDNFDRAAAAGLGSGCQVARAHLARRQHMIMIEPVELSMERSDVQARWIRLSTATEAVRIAVQLGFAGNQAEHTTTAPDTDIEVMRNYIAQPVPMTRQVQCLTVEVGAKWRGRVDPQRQRGKIANGCVFFCFC